MTSFDTIVSWPAGAGADWPQVMLVSPSSSSLDKTELPSGPKSHGYLRRRLPGQLQPRNCCFGLHIVGLWAPGTRTLGPPKPIWVEVGEDNPHSSAAALSYNWTSNCVTASFHINILYSN